MHAKYYKSCQKGGQNRIESHYHCVFLEVTKVLTKIAKVSGCEVVAEWINLAQTTCSGVQELHMMEMMK
jgi:predicted aspartyl protease